MRQKKLSIIHGLIIISTICLNLTLNKQEALAATSLNGRILIQVQSHGEAWYVNPVNSQRYYLGRPDDAFRIMRLLGLGISNKDFSMIGGSPSRLAGRILIKVEDLGRAYYFDPSDLKLYYLGRPDDAFRIMQQRGLGITNYDLSQIKIAIDSSPVFGSVTATNLTIVNPTVLTYGFKYNNLAQSISLDLSKSLYLDYASSPKVLTYQVGHEPANFREAFYALFLKLKTNDTSIDDAIYKLKSIALQNNLSSDETAALVMAWVQYIPYDHAKVGSNLLTNDNPYYPYETLYLDRGVCSDKTFLGVVLLRKLGYGAAILDFPSLNHTSVGIQCPTSDSINGSGYCYVETTNYFPLGVIPQSISAGQATKEVNNFENLFNPANLGTIEMYQKTQGKIYQGVATTKARVAALRDEKNYLGAEEVDINNQTSALKIKESNLTTMKAELDNYYNNGQTNSYNNLVGTYNALVNEYNSDRTAYLLKIESYNQRADAFNLAAINFYQQ